MSDNSLQLVCNLTGAKSTVKTDTQSYQNKLQLFGSVDNLKKYYIQPKIAKELANGKQLSSLADNYGFTLDPNKEDYYKELIRYYKKDKSGINLMQNETKINFLQTDESVKSFMKKLSIIERR